MKVRLMAAAMTALLAMSVAVGAGAASKKTELRRKETFSQQDAERAQVHVKAAMNTSMEALLAKADIQHPENMLQYGLGLYLGRNSVTASMAPADKEKLKAAYRALLDQYLTSNDKFGDVTFDEDAMLDNGDFWVYLAEHIGRPKERRPLNQAATLGGENAGTTNIFIMEAYENDNDDYNLTTEPIIKRQVANAAITCATSARSFARMKKAQTVAIDETDLSPDKFAEMRVTAARLYRSSYVLGVKACASEANFSTAAEFASQHLGILGNKKDDPTAMPVDLSTDAPELEE